MLRFSVDNDGETGGKTMNKEIEEMMLTVPQKIVAYDGNPAGQHLYGEQRLQIAEVLYDKGYGNVSEYRAEIKRLEKENAHLLKACEEQFTFNTTTNKKFSIFNLVRKEFADKVKAKLFAIFGKTICSDLDTEDITDKIDELLKEYGI